MAGGSLRKKAKRSAPMASRSVPFRHRRFCLAASFTILVVLLCVVVLLSVSSETLFRLPQSPRIYTIEVVNEYPHDPKAFTQGLLYGGNDTLFESTGLHGQSSVRKVALKTGKVETIQRMNNTYFGEGLTLLGERLYQVTWLTQTGFIYERNSLSKIERFTHQMTDGWGLATDGRVMFGSDGTSTLYQIDPQTMKVTKTQTVKHEGIEVPNLNELEFVNGEVWANIWQTDCIARISPIDGTILGWILLPNLREGLWLSGKRDIDVLNGIAWDGDEHRLFVTGKLWPKLYEIKVHPAGEKFHGDIKQLCIRMPFRP
ncbi:hypothetical protein Nepgr_031426 [Nepenthes gracilis]|uniref:Glutaminyl-peptide cyclotransferase n=1 Tax=Nepenthes gracilis TaxID=150966 RepID=A0AAD3TGJ1_NEPGR|nr:hypothetical protein Nepgr_031426 [Nepenthes gracilis]